MDDKVHVCIDDVDGTDLYKLICERMKFGDVMKLYKCLKDKIEKLEEPPIDWSSLFGDHHKYIEKELKEINKDY